MKKVICTIAVIVGLFLTVNTTYAQDAVDDAPKVHLGIGALFGSGPSGSSSVQPDFGLVVDGYYSISEKIRIGAGLHYYLPKKEEFPNGGEIKVSQFALNLNGHYLFATSGNFQPYALAGLNYMTQKVEASGSGITISGNNSEIGLNLGGGAMIGPVFVEAKYVVGNFNQFVVNGGVRFGL